MERFSSATHSGPPKAFTGNFETKTPANPLSRRLLAVLVVALAGVWWVGRWGRADSTSLTIVPNADSAASVGGVRVLAPSGSTFTAVVVKP